MSGARSGLEAAVQAIVAKHLDVPLDRVRSEAHLVGDLGADLVGLTQLALALESEFGIEIVDAEWIDVERVGHVVDYVNECVARRNAE